MLYPSANIIDYSVTFHNENTSSLKQEMPSSLVAVIDRLSMGATVIINTTVMMKKDVAVAGSANEYYIVSATFDQRRHQHYFQLEFSNY